MRKQNDIVNICLLHQCSACCNPIKIDYRKMICSEIDKYPFIDLEEIFIPEDHAETVRLKTYYCTRFNQETGLCSDYLNRPLICRNTNCFAFETDDKKKQSEIINSIKAEKFFKIKTNNANFKRRSLKCMII